MAFLTAAIAAYTVVTSSTALAAQSRDLIGVPYFIPGAPIVMLSCSASYIAKEHEEQFLYSFRVFNRSNSTWSSGGILVYPLESTLAFPETYLPFKTLRPGEVRKVQSKTTLPILRFPGRSFACVVESAFRQDGARWHAPSTFPKPLPT